MDFGPAVYRGSWAGLGRGSWLHSGGGGGAVGSWIRGFVGAVRGFVDPWGVRGFVGGSWEVRGFVGSWVSGWVRGFVDSFARFRVRGVSFQTFEEVRRFFFQRLKKWQAPKEQFIAFPNLQDENQAETIFFYIFLN